MEPISTHSFLANQLADAHCPTVLAVARVVRAAGLAVRVTKLIHEIIGKNALIALDPSVIDDAAHTYAHHFQSEIKRTPILDTPHRRAHLAAYVRLFVQTRMAHCEQNHFGKLSTAVFERMLAFAVADRLNTNQIEVNIAAHEFAFKHRGRLKHITMLDEPKWQRRVRDHLMTVAAPYDPPATMSSDNAGQLQEGGAR